jgi:hypothetical protein
MEGLDAVPEVLAPRVAALRETLELLDAVELDDDVTPIVEYRVERPA